MNNTSDVYTKEFIIPELQTGKLYQLRENHNYNWYYHKNDKKPFLIYSDVSTEYDNFYEGEELCNVLCLKDYRSWTALDGREFIECMFLHKTNILRFQTLRFSARIMVSVLTNFFIDWKII